MPIYSSRGDLPSRRDLLKLAGVGGVVFASGLAGAAPRAEKSSPSDSDFFFLQLSDTHWGYSGAFNPEADVTLKKAVATINATATRPDFVVFKKAPVPWDPAAPGKGLGYRQVDLTRVLASADAPRITELPVVASSAPSPSAQLPTSTAVPPSSPPSPGGW
jgi:hypothetical protein